MINYLVYLANLPDGDWWGLNTSSASYGGGTLAALKYALSYQFRALALVQYHKTPAYRELYQNALNSILRKYFRQDVWGNWYFISMGAKWADPDLVEYATPWADPVKEKNIMYSGHVLEMVGLWRMLYGDHKYDTVGSIKFAWRPGGGDNADYNYSHSSLMKVIYDQFMDNPWHSIECEPNAVFTVCNQPPLMGLLLYDQINGTNYFQPARDVFLDRFYNFPYFYFDTHKNMFHYKVRQNTISPNMDPKPQDEANLEMFMNVYQPDFVAEQYPYQVAMNPVLEDGTIAANDLDGWFAWLAAEMGDRATIKKFQDWLDKNANPVREGVTLYYPRDDINKMGPGDNIYFAGGLINIKDGMKIMYNNAWSDAHFAEPYISNVDYPNVLVTQAIYDSNIKSLMFTLIPGLGNYQEGKGVWKTSLNVNNLDPTQTYSIKVNGIVIGYLKNGVVKGPGLAWNEGILTISTFPQPFKASVSFVVQAK